MSWKTPERQPVASVDDRVAGLVRLAGPRTVASEEMERAVRGEVHRHWMRASARRTDRRRRRRVAVAGLAAAAAVAAVAAVSLAPRWWLHPPPRIAEVEIVRGTVRIPVPQGGSRTVAPGDVILADDELETGADAALSLRLASGASVRLDSASRIGWISATALELERGRLYVDSRNVDGATLEVRTALGTAREIGTQFEVYVDTSTLRVRIREGRVALRSADGEHVGKAGDEMVWTERLGFVQGRVALYGDSWAWTRALAPPFELEGARFEAFLDWLMRETGWQVRFSDPGLRRQVGGEILHGSLAGIEPTRAVENVLPSLGLRHRLEDGVLIIGE